MFHFHVRFAFFIDFSSFKSDIYVVAIKEADEMKRNITFIQCSLQAEFEDKLRRKATELYVM